MADIGQRERMFQALNELERRRKRKVPLDEIGRDVAEREGRGAKPYDPSVVSRWMRGLSEPRSRATWEALAAVLEVDPRWLAFGDPADPPSAAPAIPEARGSKPVPPSMFHTQTAPKKPAAKPARRRA